MLRMRGEPLKGCHFTTFDLGACWNPQGIPSLSLRCLFQCFRYQWLPRRYVQGFRALLASIHKTLETFPPTAQAGAASAQSAGCPILRFCRELATIRRENAYKGLQDRASRSFLHRKAFFIVVSDEVLTTMPSMP